MSRATALVLVLLPLGACGPAAPPHPVPAPAGTPQVVRSGNGIDINVDAAGAVSAVEIAAPPERVWTALPEAYRALGIPVATLDPASRTVGNARFAAMRQLGGRRMSELLSCAEGLAASSTADTHRMALSVLSSVHPAPGGNTRLETRVSASARSLEGSSTAAIQCGSTGVLETWVAELVRAQVNSR